MTKRWCLVLWLIFVLSFPALGQSVKVTVPNGGESWQLGTMRKIGWDVKNFGGNLDIMLYQNGKKVGNIARNVPAGQKFFSWKAGDFNGGTAVAGSGYQVWIWSEDQSFKDKSDGVFSLTGSGSFKPVEIKQVVFDSSVPLLVVKSPAAGTQVQQGGACQISWSLTGGNYGTVRIMLYPEGQPQLAKAGQVVWIAKQAPNSGSFHWKLSATERTGRYVVRVQTSDDKFFGDSGTITITSPSGTSFKTNVAPAFLVELPRKAAIKIESVDFNMPNSGYVHGMFVRLLVNSSDNFFLDPKLGNSQYGPVYLRCVVDLPLTGMSPDYKDLIFNIVRVGDSYHSLKSVNYHKLQVIPEKIVSGNSKLDLNFQPQVKKSLLGQEVIRKLAGRGGDICRQLFFPKFTITVYMATRSGEVSASTVFYLQYDTARWPLKPIVAPKEVNMCLSGIQHW